MSVSSVKPARPRIERGVKANGRCPTLSRLLRSVVCWRRARNLQFLAGKYKGRPNPARSGGGFVMRDSTEASEAAVARTVTQFDPGAVDAARRVITDLASSVHRSAM